MPEEEKVGGRRGHEAVGGQLQVRHALRLDEVRSDDDDELGLLLAVVAAAEQGPQDRDIAEKRELPGLVAEVVREQTGDGEALAVLELDRGLRAPRAQTRDFDKVYANRI